MVKGSLILENTKRVFGAHEWADKTANCIDGCKHDCKYCYSKEMAIRFKRKTPSTWKSEKVRYAQLEKSINKNKHSYMFPSSHDITPEHLEINLIFLQKLLKSSRKVLIVTKPHIECIKAICNKFVKYKSKILFRFTIGSANSDVLKFWEPGAPDFGERLESLKYAFNKGFETSVSCEPMLDNQIEEVIKRAEQFVTDYFWLGKANFLLRRIKMNGSNDEESIREAKKLIEQQNDNSIWDLYTTLQNHPKIKWKESIKEVVGLQLAKEKGLDI